VSSTALVAIQPLAEARVLVDPRLFRLKQMVVDAVKGDNSKEVVTKLRNEMESLRQERSGEDWANFPAVQEESHDSVATKVPQPVGLFELLQDREVCWQ
jgi:hypothetical protein